MRRLVFSIIVASGLVLVGVGSASAAPTPAAGAAKAVSGKKVCKVQDPRLDELSGLVATKDGFITVDDSATVTSHKRVFFLDNGCKVVKQVKYTGNGPRDTEDMALSPDGKTLWVGDIGDNDRIRPTIGLWKMAVSGAKEPVLYRLSYPVGDGPFDAEGLMINGDGTPIVVTKEPNKVSLFVPTGPLKADTTAGVPMKRAGELKLPSTTTENPFGPLGRMVATGAAVSADRSKVVIRTLADAFEWPVSNGDLLAAVKGTPTATPLPNEPQGESISYSADGRYLYTVSDMQGNTNGAENDILRYTPVVPAAPVVKAAAADSGGNGASKPSWYSNLSLDDITYLVGGVGVLGAILVGFGIFGIARSRRRRPRDSANVHDDYPNGPKPVDAETELLAVGGPGNGQRAYGAQQPGVYGGRPGPAGGPQRGAGIYGAAPSGGRPSPGGAQTGGRPGQGGLPGGRPGQGGQPPPRPSSGGVYGVPPSAPPPSRGGQAGPPQRSSGHHSDGGRQAGQGGGYADVNGIPRQGRDYDNPGYGRAPYDS